MRDRVELTRYAIRRGLIASEDWRSPFYLLALTTLIFPAATLDLRLGASGSAARTRPSRL